ncbi:hypothetical protein LEP1GSC021_2028 [Leptospira noguchii str. 1993005606]|nr:hypothetical protein LEP1GSC021_2028 [Leptospira noguchii str. 1993005606]
MEKFGRFFSIRKTYFLQVKRLILVGTLEKCALILKSSLTCVVGYGFSYSRIDLVQINKTVSINHFHETEIDGKFIFQLF